jgi:ABC-type phosphate/phosphonate transport system substrate-binding protein
MKRFNAIHHVISLLLLACLTFGSLAEGWAQQLQKGVLTVGYIESQVCGVNKRDAEAVFKTLARTLGVRNGYDLSVSVYSFETAEQLVSAMNDKTIQILIMDSWNFVKVNKNIPVEPLLVPADSSEVMKRYLLVAKDTKIKTLADFRGKSVNLITGPNCILATHWLDSLLLAAGKKKSASFFGSLEYCDDPLATVLPVFFGRRDGALIDDSKFQLLAELNPQLKRLNVVVNSEPFLNGVICFSERGWNSAQERNEMRKTLLELQDTPAGQQILTLFKAGHLIPFKEEYLQTVQKLYRGVEIQLAGNIHPAAEGHL